MIGRQPQVKRHMNVHLNEGNDIQTAQQMKVAISSNGGVSGALPVQVEVLAEPEASNISWSGISYLNNFEFTESGLRVWRSYNIGPGKVIPYHRFSPPGISEIKVIDDTESTISASFQPLHSKRRHVATLPLQPNQEERSVELDAEDSDNGVSDNSHAVFTCPEDACTMTYIKLSALEKHIESGKHKFYQEKESLLDMAKSKYANTLLKEQGAIPKVSTIERSDVDCSC